MTSTALWDIKILSVTLHVPNIPLKEETIIENALFQLGIPPLIPFMLVN